LIASGKKGDLKKAEVCLETLRKQCMGSREALDSYFISGWLASAAGRDADARKLLKQYIRMEKAEGYKAIAGRILGDKT
jgi:hypothetical protein